MRKNLKSLTVILPMAVFTLFLGSCAATSCQGVDCKAREISSVDANKADEKDDFWKHRPLRPKLRGEY